MMSKVEYAIIVAFIRHGITLQKQVILKCLIIGDLNVNLVLVRIENLNQNNNWQDVTKEGIRGGRTK